MHETDHQTCTHFWYMIEKKMCEEHAKCVKAGRYASSELVKCK